MPTIRKQLQDHNIKVRKAYEALIKLVERLGSTKEIIVGREELPMDKREVLRDYPLVDRRDKDDEMIGQGYLIRRADIRAFEKRLREFLDRNLGFYDARVSQMKRKKRTGGSRGGGNTLSIPAVYDSELLNFLVGVSSETGSGLTDELEFETGIANPQILTTLLSDYFSMRSAVPNFYLATTNRQAIIKEAKKLTGKPSGLLGDLKAGRFDQAVKNTGSNKKYGRGDWVRAIKELEKNYHSAKDANGKKLNKGEFVSNSLFGVDSLIATKVPNLLRAVEEQSNMPKPDVKTVNPEDYDTEDYVLFKGDFYLRTDIDQKTSRPLEGKSPLVINIDGNYYRKGDVYPVFDRNNFNRGTLNTLVAKARDRERSQLLDEMTASEKEAYEMVTGEAKKVINEDREKRIETLEQTIDPERKTSSNGQPKNYTKTKATEIVKAQMKEDGSAYIDWDEIRANLKTKLGLDQDTDFSTSLEIRLVIDQREQMVKRAVNEAKAELEAEGLSG